MSEAFAGLPEKYQPTAFTRAVDAFTILAAHLHRALALADALAAAVPDAHAAARQEGMHVTDEHDWDRDDYGYANCQDELCVAARAYRAARGGA